MSDARIQELIAQLGTMIEELADLALDRLGTALAEVDGDPSALRAAQAEERRLTRARHALERAVGLLGHASPES